MTSVKMSIDGLSKRDSSQIFRFPDYWLAFNFSTENILFTLNFIVKSLLIHKSVLKVVVLKILFMKQ